MREMLTKSGFDVVEGTTGVEAIEQYTAFEPDLVLLDINMPVLDGIAACQEIRKRSLRDVPIVMVTSVDDAISIENAFDVGATDFILKPINWPLLQQRLDKLLAEWRQASGPEGDRHSLELLQKVAPECVFVVNRAGEVLETISDRCGFLESTPASLAEMFDAELAGRLKQRVHAVLKSRQHKSMEFLYSGAGADRQYEAKFLAEGRDRVILVLQGVAGDQEANSEVYELAYFDTETGLPNGNLLRLSANEKIVDLDLQSGKLTCVLVKFEDLNNESIASRSEARGVAQRLVGCLAATDAKVMVGSSNAGKPVSRIGTSDFVILLANLPTDDDVRVICESIVAGFETPLSAPAKAIKVSPTIGVASFPTDARDIEMLLYCAKAAAKEAERSNSSTCFSTDAAGIHLVESVDFGTELLKAVDDDQFELHYLPRFDASGSMVSGAEALLRWHHPIRGFVPLSETLHVAKACGQIIDLGELVLRKAFDAARGWPGGQKVSVNLSQQEFLHPDLADRVVDALDASGLAADRVELEVTEAALLRMGDVNTHLNRLKALGVDLVLDDFGTGHTSLSHLTQYPLDALKIDASFVAGLPEDQDCCALVEIIVTIAKKMGMKSIGEGVESAEQLAFLDAVGCDEFQGFYFSKALPPLELIRLLEERGAE